MDCVQDMANWLTSYIENIKQVPYSICLFTKWIRLNGMAIVLKINRNRIETNQKLNRKKIEITSNKSLKRKRYQSLTYIYFINVNTIFRSFGWHKFNRMYRLLPFFSLFISFFHLLFFSVHHAVFFSIPFPLYFQ